jgi:signal transduction histidine kinase
MGVAADRLFVLASALQDTSTVSEALSVVRTEIATTIGYQHAWMYIAEDAAAHEVRLVDASGPIGDRTREVASVLRGDPVFEAMRRSNRPIVVEDARTDPRTDKELVAKLGTRTSVQVPLAPLDHPFGVFGTGTFVDEGCRPPTLEEVDFLVGIASHLMLAVGRIRMRAIEQQLMISDRLASLGSLTGGIAHEINSPMCYISLNLGLANEEIVALARETRTVAAYRRLATLNHYLESARTGLNRVERIVHDMKTMSRIDDEPRTAVDIHRMIESTANLVASTIRERAELVRVYGIVPIVDGNESRLGQVILNLLVNAVEAIPEGDRANQKITIRTGTNASGDATVTIEDSGCGISAADRHRVFDPFFTTKPHGTGLGLWICRSIVTALRGELTVDSEVGVGTRFQLVLPART